MALAQSATDSATAEVLFNEALASLEQGNPADACRKLEESQRLDPGVGTLLYLADCYRQMGRTASAWGTFREAAYLAKDRGDEREQVGLEQAAEIEPMLSYLILDVSAPPGTPLEIKHDGKFIGPALWGTAFPVDPGSHTLDVTAPGKTPWSTTINVAEGPRRERVVVPPLEDAPAAPSPSPAPMSSRNDEQGPREGNTRATLGWVLVGTGTAAVVAGGVLALLARSDDADADSHCRPDRRDLCDPSGVELGESARTKATLAGIGAGVGLAALGTGVTLLLTAPAASNDVALHARPRAGGAQFSFSSTW